MKRCYHHVTDPLMMRLVLRNLPHRGAAIISPVGSDKAWMMHKACANADGPVEHFLEQIFYPLDVVHEFEVTEFTMYERNRAGAAQCSVCGNLLSSTAGYDDKEDPRD